MTRDTSGIDAWRRNARYRAPLGLGWIWGVRAWNPARWAGLREREPSARMEVVVTPRGGSLWLETRTGRPPSGEEIALGSRWRQSVIQCGVKQIPPPPGSPRHPPAGPPPPPPRAARFSRRER